MNKFLLDGKTPAPLITEKDAADALNISQTTIKRIRYAGEINFYRIGGQIFYSLRMIEDFLNKCIQGGDR